MLINSWISHVLTHVEFNVSRNLNTMIKWNKTADLVIMINIFYRQVYKLNIIVDLVVRLVGIDTAS